ncbi:hypothetical protein D3C85_1379130 [compost metagenome]
MRRLQVNAEDGWRWVFCRKMPEHTVMTTNDKSKALPHRAEHGPDDLRWAQHEWPTLEFRLAETLEE